MYRCERRWPRAGPPCAVVPAWASATPTAASPPVRVRIPATFTTRLLGVSAGSSEAPRRECRRSEPCLRAHEARFPWRGAVLERYSALRRLVQPRTRPLRIPGFLASHSHPHWPAVIDKLASRQLQARANPTHRPRPRRGSADLISFAVGTGSWCSGLTCQPVTLEIAGSNPVEPAISFLPAPSPPGRGSPLPHGRRLRTGPRAPAPAHRPPRTGPRAPAPRTGPAHRPSRTGLRTGPPLGRLQCPGVGIGGHGPLVRTRPVPRRRR
jgi:hypothetical protein